MGSSDTAEGEQHGQAHGHENPGQEVDTDHGEARDRGQRRLVPAQCGNSTEALDVDHRERSGNDHGRETGSRDLGQDGLAEKQEGDHGDESDQARQL